MSRFERSWCARTFRYPFLLIFLALFTGCGGIAEPDLLKNDGSYCLPEPSERTQDCYIQPTEGRSSVYISKKEDLQRVCTSQCNKIEIARVTGIPGLRDLRAFQGVTIEDGVYVDRNPNLESTSGLTVTGDIYMRIQGNPKLQDLKGFAAVTETSTFHIEGNKRLKSLGSLQNVDTVTGPLVFWQTSIQDFSPLDGIQINTDTELHKNVYFEENNGLETLPELRGTALNVTIQDNPNLVDVSGLLSLEKLYQVHLTDNPKLPRCHIEEVVNQLEYFEESERTTDIRNNGSGDCSGG